MYVGAGGGINNVYWYEDIKSRPLFFCQILSRLPGKTFKNAFSYKRPVDEKRGKRWEVQRTWSLLSLQYTYLYLSLFSWFKKMEEQAPKKMLLFWGVHKSTVISVNCDFSPKINKINSLPWLSGTWCRSIREQTGTSLYISFHAYQLMALKVSSQILSGSAVFNGIKQRWKIMPKELSGSWKRPIP